MLVWINKIVNFNTENRDHKKLLKWDEEMKILVINSKQQDKDTGNKFYYF